MNEGDRKLIAKLNRLYKKYEKVKDEETCSKIRKTCDEAGISYELYMDYMAGEPTTVALVQSILTSLPVVENIKKEDSHGSKEDNRNKGR